MIAVTIGVGPKFAPLAEMAAASCASRTGLPVEIMGDAAMTKYAAKTPLHLKFKLFEEFPHAETILFFDADVVFARPWDAREWAGAEEFICVRDLWDKGWIVSDAEDIGIPPRDYFNAGIFIVNRTRHLPMLRLAAKLCGRFRSNFYDQTALNAARAWLDIPTRYLPKAYNYLVTHWNAGSDLEDLVVLHLLGVEESPIESHRRYYQYWQPAPISESPALHQVALRLLVGTYNYERVGHDQRPIRLGDDGYLAEGSAACETHWHLTEEEGRPVLWLGNRHFPICALEEDTQGIWHGRWLRWEQMPIRLTPVSQT